MAARRGPSLRAALLIGVVIAVLAGCSALRNGTPHSSLARSSGVAAQTAPAPTVAPGDVAADGASSAALPRPAGAGNACATNTLAQLVKVSLHQQRLWMCAHTTTVYSTPITSGITTIADDRTPTGNFEIQGRNRNTTLTLNTGKEYAVKYWIPFSAPLYGFHDASWQRFAYGSPLYRTQGSHGCIHMPLKAIAYLYHWVHVGTAVQIRA
jgi:lipoprotein-anchoring transpeptidase ErfK/SrfK